MQSLETFIRTTSSSLLDNELRQMLSYLQEILLISSDNYRTSAWGGGFKMTENHRTGAVVLYRFIQQSRDIWRPGRYCVRTEGRGALINSRVSEHFRGMQLAVPSAARLKRQLRLAICNLFALAFFYLDSFCK